MKTLGLDIGTNSIGWALVYTADKKVAAAGAHIFQAGVNIDGGKETPKNAARREYRQKRRQLARRRFRNNLLRKALQQVGMMPAKTEQPEFWQTCPYQFRSKGLSAELTLHEFGRAIFHLNQRRGFKSNRKSGNAEVGAMQKGGNGKTGINQTEEEWQKGGFRTFGEYLASLDPHEQRLRNRYTLRQWYQQEFDLLWQEQQRYHPTVLTDDLKQKLGSPDAGIVFYQRPLKSQKHLVGKCTLEPKKTRIPLSHQAFEEFRMWQILNNLEITGPDRLKEPLDDEEKSKLVELFYTKESIKATDIRKKLKLTEDYTLNYEDETFRGNETSIKLGKLFGKDVWQQLSDLDKTLPENAAEKQLGKLEVWHTLFFAEDTDWLQNYAQEKWDFTEKQLQQLRKTHLREGYGSLSHKAIQKMLPHLRQGYKYDEAARLAGYHHSQISDYDENLEKLGAPKNLRNPIVQQALYELRTLVNQIIQEHGKPEVVRVELSRDMKVSADKRAQIRAEQQRNRSRNQGAYEYLKSKGIGRPSKEAINKYHLWKECNQICPYTGAQISFTDLFEYGRFEIEHILPYSRTLDDSLANKTLCERGFNNNKGNKTPFECLSGNALAYQQVLDRVRGFSIHNFRQKDSKLKKFMQEKLDEDFAQKQLNDTRYISREAQAYLKSLGIKVQVATGNTTAPLRHYWGLNSILNQQGNYKSRDDHRHHAVDALVVALTTPAMLNEMSRWNSLGRALPLHNYPMPWESFYRDARSAIENILVSQKQSSRTISTWNKKETDKNGNQTVQRHVSPRGQLHKETVYGKRRDLLNNEFYVVRKNLQDLTPAMVHKIVDPAVRELVKDRIRKHDENPEGKKFTIPKTAFTEPLYMPNIKGKTGRQNPIKKVRIKENSTGMVQLKQDMNQWVEPGNNHHVAIYIDEAGRKYEEVVTFYEAVERKKQGLTAVQPVHKEGHRLYATLQINDMFLLGIPEDSIDWSAADLHEQLKGNLYRVQKLSASYYTFRKHNAATINIQDEEFAIRSMKGWEAINPIKVNISTTGKFLKV
ncbi:type II CRISPR RNA-guided endonuclease Cas9 [Pontibacter sp. CAU 1760]